MRHLNKKNKNENINDEILNLNIIDKIYIFYLCIALKLEK